MLEIDAKGRILTDKTFRQLKLFCLICGCKDVERHRGHYRVPQEYIGEMMIYGAKLVSEDRIEEAIDKANETKIYRGGK